jgi:hypothetical protein
LEKRRGDASRLTASPEIFGPREAKDLYNPRAAEATGKLGYFAGT